MPELKITNAVQEIAEDATAVTGTFEVIDPDSDAGTAQTFQIKGVEGVEGVEDTILKEGTQPTEGKTGGSSATFTTDYGTLTLNPEGTWEYELDNTSEAVRALADGDTKTETFEVTVIDEHGATSTQTITVTIKGTNDTPQFDADPNRLLVVESGVGRLDEHTFVDNSNPATQGDENAPYEGLTTVNGQFTVSDVDHDARLQIAVDSVKPEYIDSDGNPIDEPQALDNEAAYNSYDPNNRESKVDVDGTYGRLTLHADGFYTYTLDESKIKVDSLAEGEVAHDTFLIYVRDEKGAWTTQTLIVDVHGTNDRPTLGLSKDVLEVTEAGQAIDEETGKQYDVSKEIDKGTAEGADVDNGAQLTYAFINEDGETVTEIDTEYGKLTIDSVTGEYQFKIYNHAGKVNELKAGDTVNLGEFTIRVTDENGAFAEDTIAVKINGSNDKPVMEGSSVSVKEFGVANGGNVELSKYSNESNVQKIKVTDRDGDTEFTFAITNEGAVDDGNGIQHLDTDYGTYFLNTKTGEYWFELNNDSPKVNELKAEKSLEHRTNRA
ncbi:MAG: VCBS domain-containing protein [Bilophila sp.]